VSVADATNICENAGRQSESVGARKRSYVLLVWKGGCDLFVRGVLAGGRASLVGGGGGGGGARRAASKKAGVGRALGIFITPRVGCVGGVGGLVVGWWRFFDFC